MVKYKIIILTLAFLAALIASLSIPNWGSSEKQPLSFVPAGGIEVAGERHWRHWIRDLHQSTSSPLRFWPWF